MLVTTKAIVIHTIRYSEADLIAKCFTESDGLKSYMLRNILKSKKGKLKKSLFQPLAQLEIVARHHHKGSLSYLREAQLYKPYNDLHTNIYKTSIVMFLAEVLRNAIQEEEKNMALYQFLEDAFYKLDSLSETANFHIGFLVQLTRFLGFSPNISSSNAAYFNLVEGNFQHIESGNYCVSEQNSVLLKEFLQLNFQNFSSLKLNRQKRKDFLEIILLYYQLHLQGFYKPKSLEVLNQLF